MSFKQFSGINKYDYGNNIRTTNIVSNNILSDEIIMNGEIDMCNYCIKNVPLPTQDDDVVNKKYVDDALGTNRASGNAFDPTANITFTGENTFSGELQTFKNTNGSTSLRIRGDGNPVLDIQNTGNEFVFRSGGTGHLPIGFELIGDEVLRLSDNLVDIKADLQMHGDIDMCNNFIKNVPLPTQDSDATNKKYVDDALGTVTSFQPSSNIRFTGANTFAGKLQTFENSNGSTALRIRGDGNPVLDIQNTGNEFVFRSGGTGHLPIGFELTGNEVLRLSDNVADIKTNLQMHGVIDMCSNIIKNLPLPTQDGDVTNKKYVDDALGTVTSFDPTSNITFTGANIFSGKTQTFINSNGVASLKIKGDGRQLLLMQRSTNEFEFISAGSENLPISFKKNNSEILRLSDNIVINGELDASGNSIINVPLPTQDGDVANKKYVDDEISKYYTGCNIESINGPKNSNDINTFSLDSGWDTFPLLNGKKYLIRLILKGNFVTSPTSLQIPEFRLDINSSSINDSTKKTGTTYSPVVYLPNCFKDYFETTISHIYDHTPSDNDSYLLNVITYYNSQSLNIDNIELVYTCQMISA